MEIEHFIKVSNNCSSYFILLVNPFIIMIFDLIQLKIHSPLSEHTMEVPYIHLSFFKLFYINFLEKKENLHL